MKNEKEIIAKSGVGMLLLILSLIVLAVVGPIFNPIMGILSSLLAPTIIILLLGCFIVQPNSSRVLVFFGKYVGTVKDNGFFWTNPFNTKRKISLKARNFDSERVKVNDKHGNPILISVIAVWRVKDTYAAAFDVDDYEHFVRVQTDAAVRKLAGMYAYDNFDDTSEITLRGGTDQVNNSLEKELDERLTIAGIEVLEARIGYLAYAQEIANSMLKRQQATAIVSARMQIVEGAVGMVEAALDQLSKREIVELDDDKKAAMVSNLMVVLCSDKDATPVLNTGTLNQ